MNTPLPLELKKEIKKDVKKETVNVVQNESNLLKLVPIKEPNKELPKEPTKEVKNKDALPQRDNSKATSQKEDNKPTLKANSSHKEAPPAVHSAHVAHHVHGAHPTPKDPVVKDHQPISTSDELADLLIGTITNAKMADFRPNATSSSTKQANSTAGTGSVLDDLRIKVIEQVHLKARIFFQALTSSQLLRETSSSIKNKNDGLNKLSNSIYSSIPYLRPFQAASTRPPANSNSWCGSLSSSFTQYSQLNAFLVAAFLLFPIVIPFYLFGWLTLFLLRAAFCIGAKQIVTSIVYRIRSS